MLFRYPNLVTLNSVNLTDESREALQQDIDRREIMIELASGSKVKFIKAVKHKWSMQWSQVSENASHTIDGYGGRDEINTVANLGTTMTFTIHDGHHSTENYTVFIDSYSEQLLMRRNGTNYYSCTLSLLER